MTVTTGRIIYCIESWDTTVQHSTYLTTENKVQNVTEIARY